MPFVSARLLQICREQFVVRHKENLRWFPGHMSAGLKKMQQVLKTVDCIIEVHDARIPLSGRNPNFKQSVIGTKPHILVLNKTDLIDQTKGEKIKKYIQRTQNINHIVYTNCKIEKKSQYKELVPIIQESIKSSNRYNRFEETEFNIMVIGVPNVGKSSLINALRVTYLKKGKAALVGPYAGVTRAVQNKIKVSNMPTIFILDTPGILTPSVESVDTGMKLALCSTLKDHLVGPVIMADYLLYWLNKQKVYTYFNFFEIDEPCDDINMLLAKKCIAKNWYFRVRLSGDIQQKLNLVTAANMFIQSFRSGLLGGIILDSDILPFK